MCYTINMSTAELTEQIKKLNKEVKQLHQEHQDLAKFVLKSVAIDKDEEGEYLPEFIERILRAEKEKSKYRYNSKTFLKLIA